VAKSLDLTETALRDWVRRAEVDAGKGPVAYPDHPSSGLRQRASAVADRRMGGPFEPPRRVTIAPEAAMILPMLGFLAGCSMFGIIGAIIGGGVLLLGRPKSLSKDRGRLTRGLAVFVAGAMASAGAGAWLLGRALADSPSKSPISVWSGFGILVLMGTLGGLAIVFLTARAIPPKMTA
jgi:hypothetical protein